MEDSQLNELQTLLIQWTKLDKQLKEINQQASTIRKFKDDIQKQVCPLIQENKLEYNIFSIFSIPLYKRMFVSKNKN